MFRMRTTLTLFLLSTLSLVVTASAIDAPKVEDIKAKDEVKAISKALGKKMTFFETKSFTWCSSKAEGQMSKVKKNAERAFQIISKDAGFNDWRGLWGDQKTMICLFANKSDFRRYNEWYAETYPVWSKAEFLKNRKSVYYAYVSQTRRSIAMYLKPADLEQIEQVVAHQVGCLGANRLYFHNNFTPPWLESALGTWVEAKATSKVGCEIGSGSYGSPFDIKDKPKDKLKKFKKKMKAAVKKGRLKNFAGLTKVRLHKVSYEDVQKGYAIIDWMHSERGQFSKFVRALKKHWPADISYDFQKTHLEAQEKALKEVFKLDAAGLEKAVKGHAKKL